MRTTRSAREGGKVLQALLCVAALALAPPVAAQNTGEVPLADIAALLERSQRALQDEDWEAFAQVRREIEALNARELLEGRIEPVFALLHAHFVEDAALMRLIDEIKLRVVSDRPAAEAAFDGVDAEIWLGTPLIFELSTYAATIAAGFYVILPGEEMERLDFDAHFAAWTDAIGRDKVAGNGSWPRFGSDALYRLSPSYRSLAVRYSGDAASAAVAWIVLHELAHHALCHVGQGTRRCAGVAVPQDRIDQEAAADSWATERAYDMGLSLEAIATGLGLFGAREDIRDDLRADAGLPEHVSDTHPAWRDRLRSLVSTHRARGLNPDMLRLRLLAFPMSDGTFFGGRIVTPHRCDYDYSMTAAFMPLSFDAPDFALDFLGCSDDYIWEAEPRRIEGWVGDSYMRIDVAHPHDRLSQVQVHLGTSPDALGDPFPLTSVLMAGATELPQNIIAPEMLRAQQDLYRATRTRAIVHDAGFPAELRAGAEKAMRSCTRSLNTTMHGILTGSKAPSLRDAADRAAIDRKLQMHRQVCDYALSEYLGPPWDARLKRAETTLLLESGLTPALRP